MQNTDVQSAINKGVLMAAYNPETFQGFLDLNDLAEVASQVILNPGDHNLARYELVGENTTLENVAQMISRITGRSNLRCELVPREQLLDGGIAHLKVENPYTREGLSRMLYYYDQR